MWGKILTFLLRDPINFQHLLDSLPLFAVAHLIYHMSLEVVFKHHRFKSSNSAFNCLRLSDDINAIFFCLDHSLKTSGLAFDTMQSSEQSFFHFLIHTLHYIPPWGISQWVRLAKKLGHYHQLVLFAHILCVEKP